MIKSLVLWGDPFLKILFWNGYTPNQIWYLPVSRNPFFGFKMKCLEFFQMIWVLFVSQETLDST